MTDSTSILSRKAEFLLYQAEDGRTRVEVRFDGETAWLSLGQMTELFQRDKSVISRHIKNVFDEGELDRAPVVAEFATTGAEKAELEYDRLAAARAALPSRAEKHFEEALREIKQLEKKRPSPSKARQKR